MAKHISINIILVALFLCLMSRGTQQQQQPCSSGRGLIVNQVATGKTVQNKPEWKVTVSNDCSCTQQHVTVNCNNFQTVEKVDANVFADQGDGKCLVREDAFNDRILARNNVVFIYAWDTQFPFNVVSNAVSCS